MYNKLIWIHVVCYIRNVFPKDSKCVKGLLTRVLHLLFSCIESKLKIFMTIQRYKEALVIDYFP